MARRTNATPVGKPGGYGANEAHPTDRRTDMAPDDDSKIELKGGKPSNTGSDKGPSKGAGAAPPFGKNKKYKGDQKGSPKGRGFSSLSMKHPKKGDKNGV